MTGKGDGELVEEEVEEWMRRGRVGRGVGVQGRKSRGGRGRGGGKIQGEGKGCWQSGWGIKLSTIERRVEREEGDKKVE